MVPMVDDCAFTPAELVLDNGARFAGRSFGAPRPVGGEVVFNTAMTGYPESLTDPSYHGQILTLTYPLVGNYGVPEDDRDAHGLSRHFESASIHVAGLVISDYSARYSHWTARRSLAAWLREAGIPGLCGVDTRALTRLLREQGVRAGRIVFPGENEEPATPPLPDHPVAAVSTPRREAIGQGRYRVVLVDCGVKHNIIRCLLERDATVLRVPWDDDFTDEPRDGLFISNGPGDPARCEATIRHLSKALTREEPLFGICLGSQLLALAGGAQTYKLPYGHRGHNQPVRRCGTDRAYITSQNHGYAVDEATLGESWEPLFTNLNDGTNEGFRHRLRPYFAAQFHPEAAGGPSDTRFLFDEFARLMALAR